MSHRNAIDDRVEYVGSTKEEEVGGVEDRAAWRGGA